METERTVVGDGVEIAARRHGSGARDVVFVHGWMTTGAVFDKLVYLLDDDTIRAWIMDLRGGGASTRDAGDYTLDQFAADVCQLIERNQLNRPVLVGHSMGGQIAQLAAARLGDKISGMVLLNPVPVAGLELPSNFRPLFESAAQDASARATILEHSTLKLDDGDHQRLVELSSEVAPRCIADALDAWTGGEDPAVLAQITVPTLVIATDDAFLPRSLLQQAVADPIANAWVEYVAGPGHYPHVEATEPTADLLNSFFASVS